MLLHLLPFETMFHQDFFLEQRSSLILSVKKMEEFRGGLLDAIDFVSKQNGNSDKQLETIDLTEDENTMDSLQNNVVRKRHFPSYGGIYSCKFCKQSRSTQRAIMQHVNEVHLKVKPYSCKHCTHCSRRKSDLETHVQCVHLKLKPFQCDKCNYECKQKEALKRHKEVEHEGKRFNCNECEHSFLSSSALEGHKQRVHRQVLHKCDLCDYTNSRRSNLKEHVESKHRNIRHPCDECPYTGVSKAWLELIVFYSLVLILNKQVHSWVRIFNCF